MALELNKIEKMGMVDKHYAMHEAALISNETISLTDLIAMSILTRAKNSRTISETLNDYSKYIHEKALEVQATYNTALATAWMVTAAGITAASGASGLMGTATKEQAKFISTLGSGATGVNGLFNNSSEAARQLANHELERLRGKEDAHKTSKQSEKDAMQREQSALAEAERNKKEALRAFFR